MSQKPPAAAPPDLPSPPELTLKSRLMEHCLFCDPWEHDQEKQILLRSDNLYLFAGLGPIVEGYLIIAPYRCDDPRWKLSSFSDATPELIDELIFMRGIVSAFYRDCFKHPGMHFEHGRTGVCLYGRKDTRHCYHAHLCCYPQSYPIWEDMVGLKAEELGGLYDLKRKAGDSPYLFVQACEIDEQAPIDKAERERWPARIVLLEHEKQIEPQYLRKLLAKRAGHRELWNWAQHPGQEMVERLAESFSRWVKATDRYAISDDADGVPRIGFLQSVVRSNRIGNDYVAERFYRRWRGFEQYDSMGRFLQRLPDRGDQRPRILDAGCGPGTYLNAFYAMGVECVGIDLSEKMLKVAHEVLKGAALTRRPDHPVPLPRLLKGNAFEPDFDERSFDGIWYCAVFVHVPKLQAPHTLAALHRILKDDGVLYLSAQVGGGSVVRYEGRVFFYYTDEELRRLFAKAGFVVADAWETVTDKSSCGGTREKPWLHYLLKKRPGPDAPLSREAGLRLADLGERGVLEHIRNLLASEAGEQVVVGIGDDGAVIRPVPGELLVVTTDPCPQPVISLLGDRDRWYDGWYSMIINLSDLGAMGAKPLGILLALEAEEDMAVQDLERFYAGVLEASRAFHCPVIGGNVKDAPRFNCVGTAFGSVHPERLLRRGGARPGERLVVLGEMGLFWAGVIHQLQPVALEPAESDALLERLKRPRPRLGEALAIAEKRLSRCAIDSSDGLVACFYEIARAGQQIDVHIDLAGVEAHPLVKKVAAAAEIDVRKLMLAWGDWELVCTVTEDALPVLRDTLAEFDCTVAEVGWIAEGQGHTWFHDQSVVGRLNYIASERFTQRSYFSHGLAAYLDLMRREPLYRL